MNDMLRMIENMQKQIAMLQESAAVLRYIIEQEHENRTEEESNEFLEFKYRTIGMPADENDEEYDESNLYHYKAFVENDCTGGTLQRGFDSEEDFAELFQTDYDDYGSDIKFIGIYDNTKHNELIVMDVAHDNTAAEVIKKVGAVIDGYE